jgi:hypothetical protein
MEGHMIPDPHLQYLTPEEFAILPWGNTPGEPAVLADIKRCGFNLAGFVQPGDLDAVREAGLKAIVADESIHVTDAAAGLDKAEIARRVQALVAQVKGHPALFGYYLRDEPGAGIYPGLRRWSRALRAADIAAQPYINLFPNYATREQLGVETYEEYVEAFLRTVEPPFLSYDHYALMEGGKLREGYFQNLEIIRAAALRQGIPFWNIVLANAHFSHTEPTSAGLRFQVYTTLAYGGRGISYFTYFTPDRGNYRLAPIDQFGEKTPTWAMLRQVNLQILSLGPTYVRLSSANVFHHPDVPPGCSGAGSSRFLDEVNGGSFVIGEFAGPGDRPHVMVVNKDLLCSTSFVVRFKEAGKVLRTSPYSGAAHPEGDEDNWLAPGQGVLLSLA